MRRTAVVFAMLVAISAVSIAAGDAPSAAPADSTSPTPRDPKVETWFAAVAAVDSGIVWRLEPTPGDSTAPAERRWRPVNHGVVTSDWIRRFAAFLAATPCFPDRFCEHADWPDSNRLMLAVRFKGRPVPAARLMIQRGCGELSSAETPVGTLDLSGRRATLLALAREALPGDTAVAALAGLVASLPPGAPDGVRPVLKRFSEVEVLPVAIDRVPPVYPRDALKRRIAGTVLVLALVGTDGAVKDVRIKNSIPALDSAAVRSVRAWKFQPATSEGRPVAVWVSIPVKFKQ